MNIPHFASLKSLATNSYCNHLQEYIFFAADYILAKILHIYKYEK